jgi:hypothetical protein
VLARNQTPQDDRSGRNLDHRIKSETDKSYAASGETRPDGDQSFKRIPNDRKVLEPAASTDGCKADLIRGGAQNNIVDLLLFITGLSDEWKLPRTWAGTTQPNRKNRTRFQTSVYVSLVNPRNIKSLSSMTLLVFESQRHTDCTVSSYRTANGGLIGKQDLKTTTPANKGRTYEN